LATSLVSPVLSPASLQEQRREEHRRERGFAVALVTALTAAALVVHGYHPYAEDGAVYMPEIKRLVDPTLYPHGAEFVMGHLKFSLFAPLMAWLARWTHAGVEATLWMVYGASLWGMLFAGWMVASRCWWSREARCGAVALLAVWITMPIAGTSLMLMDPYVTARSLASPFAVLALAGALDFLMAWSEGERSVRGVVLCGVGLTVAGMMHPLVGAYTLGSVLMLAVVMAPSRSMRLGGAMGLGLAGVAMAAGLQMEAAAESGMYQRVALTRHYAYLSQWHWYELVGLVAPLLILFVVGWRRGEEDAARVGLARMAVGVGVGAMVVAALFARTGMTTHLVARLQPLRIFQTVYVVMILTLGAALGEFVLRRRVWRWAAVFLLLAGVMIFAERRTFPASERLELPMTLVREARVGSGNAWEDAFFWIRGNTPKDALFALDAQYITRPGEDAQGFRAIAERSVLPDYSKDGGVVTNEPQLTDEWYRGETAQTGLDERTDAARIAALKPLGVTWVVLERGAVTGFVCGYENAAVKVCRLP
jgi:hypothetical protein